MAFHHLLSPLGALRTPGFRLFVSGARFQPSQTAMCRLGGTILAPAEAF